MATFPGRATLPESEPAPIEEPTRRIQRATLESDVAPAARQSHIAPTLAAQCDAHVQAALSASVRTEARLGALFRVVQHFSAGVSSAREANDQLAQELEVLRDLLGTSNEEQAELRHQVVVLEQALARAEQEAIREREFLIDQQDAFIQLLCRDQEREVEELARLRLERDQLRGDFARVQAQRDEAQAAVVRIASERDQALIELSRTRSSDRARAVATVKSDSSARPIAKLELETIASDIPSAPAPATLPPPSSSPPSSSVSSTRPPLKQKPDPSTRPLIGYSLAGDEIFTENPDAAETPSRPPDR